MNTDKIYTQSIANKYLEQPSNIFAYTFSSMFSLILCMLFIFECPPFDFFVIGFADLNFIILKGAFLTRMIGLTFFEPRFQRGVFYYKKME